EDIEADMPRCSGLILRERPTPPSNFRSNISLDAWLKKNNISGICGVDTRALTCHIRKNGAQNAVIFSGQWSVVSDRWKKELTAEKKKLLEAPDMSGLDLAKPVTTKKPYEWNEGLWKLATDHRPLTTHFHVVAIDYGIKKNILRSLAEVGCKVTVVPATASAE